MYVVHILLWYDLYCTKSSINCCSPVCPLSCITLLERCENVFWQNLQIYGLSPWIESYYSIFFNKVSLITHRCEFSCGYVIMFCSYRFLGKCRKRKASPLKEIFFLFIFEKLMRLKKTTISIFFKFCCPVHLPGIGQK